MGEFNSLIKEGEDFLKALPGAKANQLNYQTIPVNSYDTELYTLASMICCQVISLSMTYVEILLVLD